MKARLAIAWAAGLLAASILGAAAWSGYAPVSLASRDELFEIPKGTWARRMAGDKVEILPDTIKLTLGLNDVLLPALTDTLRQPTLPHELLPADWPGAALRDAIDRFQKLHGPAAVDYVLSLLAPR